MNMLLWSLISVAVGTSDRFIRIPSEDDWGMMYSLAKKMSLVGLGFYGISKLFKSDKTEQARAWNIEHGTEYLPRPLFLKWMQATYNIQERNVLVNEKCKELSGIFTEAGFGNCILKGQGASLMYNELSSFRQSGDIDIWVDGGREKVLEFIRRKWSIGAPVYHHVDAKVYADIAVEVHYLPAWLYNPFHDIKLQKWFKNHSKKQFENLTELGFASPTPLFNLVFGMVHMYKHKLGNEPFAKQIIDYYFVLLHSDKKCRKEAYQLLCELGLGGFCSYIMSYMTVRLNICQELILCQPSDDWKPSFNEKVWKFLWRTWQWCWRKCKGYK